jgi:diguanylate cyclase
MTSNSQSPVGGRRWSEARIRRAKTVHLAISATYGYECLLLAGFWAAGYIGLWIVLLFTACGAGFNGAVFVIYRYGWNLRLRDPSLFLAQQSLAIILAFGLALAAPQIAIQPFGTWIAISFFGFMAPTRRYVYITWGASLVAATIALAIGGSRIAMPTSTLAGQGLTGAVVLGVLARGIGVTDFVAGLRRRLKEKNEALRAALARIEILAQQDELTGLANRRSVLQWLGEQLSLCERSGHPLTIALLDLDHFKSINDDFGHPAGDRVLEIFSRHALAAIRATDRFGRYGGEEFLVVLVATSLQAARDPLERIRSEIAACDWSGINRNLRVTVTIGAAAYRRGDTVKDLIARADLALYRGKEGGRNRVVLEDGGLSAISSAKSGSPIGELEPRRHADPSPPDGGTNRPPSDRSSRGTPEFPSDENALFG